ncbi:phosphotransferase [Fictibacillus iocasae]|uniref:Phosphotransferase n=1 Tax=Fictibacillus iocasae TaxID=2715437 RepID=A0ABW2NRY4_9BACL
MEHVLGKEWRLYPAGGATGEAYIAQHEEQRLFLKRNSSPFLAVLSAEGIVPKLLWTKRLENGDVISAQQWLDGRELKSVEMKNSDVARLLGKIHSSNELLEMLKRLGKMPLTPELIIADLQKESGRIQHRSQLVKEAIARLMEDKSQIQSEEKVVCHCDVNHNNWMLSKDSQLFLIDWDGAMVADPALDLGMLLYSYIPREEWEEWLADYNMTLSPDLEKRMHWYVTAQTVFMHLQHVTKGDTEKAAETELSLCSLLSQHSPML